nr:hypothetical protein [Vibrio cholerae]
NADIIRSKIQSTFTMFGRMSVHRNWIRTVSLRAANTESVAVTVTRPVNPAGRVIVTFIASPGPVTAGATVTPAA